MKTVYFHTDRQDKSKVQERYSRINNKKASKKSPGDVGLFLLERENGMKSDIHAAGDTAVRRLYSVSGKFSISDSSGISNSWNYRRIWLRKLKRAFSGDFSLLKMKAKGFMKRKSTD